FELVSICANAQSKAQLMPLGPGLGRGSNHLNFYPEDSGSLFGNLIEEIGVFRNSERKIKFIFSNSVERERIVCSTFGKIQKAVAIAHFFVFHLRPSPN